MLALAARRFGVQIHAFCVLSNHFHAVVTDPHACLPAFEQYLNSLVARAVNALLGRWEAFWAPSSYSAVALVSTEDVIAKTAYVVANPVAAGLVSCGREWPGLWTGPEQVGRERFIVRRPKTFFRANAYLPEVVELELVPPPGLAPEAFRAQVAEAVVLLEGEARAKLASRGHSALGSARILAQRPWAHPMRGEPRRGLNPRVAAQDKWKRIEALSRLADFLGAYRAAWAKMRAGAKDAVFPAGTYLLRVAYGMQCAAAP